LDRIGVVSSLELASYAVSLVALDVTSPNICYHINPLTPTVAILV